MTDTESGSSPVLSLDQQERSRDLRSMKSRATSFLLVAAVVFVVVRIFGDDGWKGYVIATAEAAMVGGIADWFAVTALFKHPLYLPIPHTAIIPARKDAIGRSLGEFVEINFLDEDLIAERVHNARVGPRLGAWLAEPENARRVSAEALIIAHGVTEVLDDELIHDAVERMLTTRVRNTPMAPLMARMLDVVIETDQHQTALDSVLVGLDRLIEDNQELFRNRLAEESPWWVPDAIDDRIFARIVSGTHRLIQEVAADPDHPVRLHLSQRTVELARRLREDPELARKVDELRDDLLDRPQIREWTSALWTQFEDEIAHAADHADAPMRLRLDRAIETSGRRLREDPDTQETVEGWLVTASRHAANQLRGEASDLIATTVQRWDATDTGRLIELQIGRDLQFIRINGTVVGGLVGLAIHVIGELLG